MAAAGVFRDVVHLEFRYAAQAASERKFDAWLLADLTWWGDSSIEPQAKAATLVELYERLQVLRQDILDDQLPAMKTLKSTKRAQRVLPDQNHHMAGILLLLHPTPPSEFDEALSYGDLRLLLNQGDNFVAPDQYTRYGGYQIGALPIYPAAGDPEFRNIQRFKRLIRIQMFSLGQETLCWRCFHVTSAVRMVGEHNEYECYNSNCRLRWGEVICRQCGHRYFKMKAPRTASRKIDLSF